MEPPSQTLSKTSLVTTTHSYLLLKRPMVKRLVNRARQSGSFPCRLAKPTPSGKNATGTHRPSLGKRLVLCPPLPIRECTYLIYLICIAGHQSASKFIKICKKERKSIQATQICMRFKTKIARCIISRFTEVTGKAAGTNKRKLPTDI